MMRILKAVLKLALGVVIAGLLLAPLYLIYQISVEERKAYTAPETPVLRQSAYGEAVQAVRQDVQVFTQVSGVGVCKEFADQDLRQRRPDLIRWSVSVGDVVEAGQTIGALNGEEILAEHAGVIEQINAYSSENAYVRYLLLEPVVLECSVDASTLWMLQNATALTTESGELLAISYVSPICNTDGTTTVRLSSEVRSFRYGELLEKFRIYTGKTYTQTLVLDRRCLFQKVAGDGNPWYARKVTEDGYYLEDVEITVGYMTGEVACVSGIAAGDWFDAGAQAVTGG